MFGLIRRLGSGGRSVQITTLVSTGNAAAATVICANEHAQALGVERAFPPPAKWRRQ